MKVLIIEMAVGKEDETDMTGELQDTIMAQITTIVEDNSCLIAMFGRVVDEDAE